MPASWISAGAAVLGAANASKGSGGGSSSSKVELDPKMRSLLYGDDEKLGGLLGNIQNVSNQQLAQGGLNPMQNAGMELQRQWLTSPEYQQGFDAMKSTGLGLMGRGVASNPFAQSASQGNSYMPQMQAQNPNTSVAYTPLGTQTQAQPAQQSVEDMIDAYMKANGLGKYAAAAGGWKPGDPWSSLGEVAGGGAGGGGAGD